MTKKTIKEIIDQYGFTQNECNLFLESDVNLSESELRKLAKRSSELALNAKINEMQNYNGHSMLKDPEFLCRLKYLNIPNGLLSAIEDKHKSLSDSELWELIRNYSGRK